MKSLLSKSISTLRLAAALLVPALAVSCQMMKEDFVDEIADSSATQYINITVSVSAGNNPVTRAYPMGGEYGDGVEKGLENNNINENKVNDITLIFFELPANQGGDPADGPLDRIQGDGPNAPKVSCVKRYTVYPTSNHAHTEPHPDAPEGYNDLEVVYTTGNQRLDETSLEIGKTYHVLVVANTFVDVSVDEPVKEVLDKVMNVAYTGTGVGINASDFVMTSESDAVVTLDDNTKEPVSAGSNEFVYNFQCIHIERLAARLDFWAKNSNGYKTGTDEAPNRYSETPGYEYNVKKTDGTTTIDTGDRFVLTAITPFNLNNGDEYMLKRLTNNFHKNAGPDHAAGDPDKIHYLADEVATTGAGPQQKGNYVLDPYIVGKTSTTAHPDYLVSTLESVFANFSNDYSVSMASQQDYKISIGSNDNIILGYPKENTLKPGTPLYYYATGLAFEGYYYEAGQTTGTRFVFYYFIRHQGEASSLTAYQAFGKETLEAQKTTLVAPIPPEDPNAGNNVVPAMNFGIVRNNIYRISIESISVMRGTLKLRLEEEKWRHVDNPIIYI